MIALTVSAMLLKLWDGPVKFVIQHMPILFVSLKKNIIDLFGNGNNKNKTT